jgi:hypothetical protein
MPDPELDDDDGELPDVKISDIKRGNDRSDDNECGGVDDAVEKTIDSIVEVLSARGPGGVARIRQYANALTAMADSYMDRDSDALSEAAGDAYRALRHLISN